MTVNAYMYGLGGNIRLASEQFQVQHVIVCSYYYVYLLSFETHEIDQNFIIFRINFKFDFKIKKILILIKKYSFVFVLQLHFYTTIHCIIIIGTEVQ